MFGAGVGRSRDQPAVSKVGGVRHFSLLFNRNLILYAGVLCVAVRGLISLGCPSIISQLAVVYSHPVTWHEARGGEGPSRRRLRWPTPAVINREWPIARCKNAPTTHARARTWQARRAPVYCIAHWLSVSCHIWLMSVWWGGEAVEAWSVRTR